MTRAARARRRNGARSRRVTPGGSERAAERPAEPRAVPPTPQTVRKLRRDLILQLHESGRLRSEHLRAAEEIRRIWQAFSRGLGPSAVNPASPGSRGPSGRQPLEWLSDREEIIWRNRYRPWANETSAIPSGGLVGATRLRIVVDLAVDNGGLRQVDGWYRMRNGASFEHLRDGLHRYAVIGGWIESP